MTKTAKTPLKVGDRVAVYNYAHRFTARIANVIHDRVQLIDQPDQFRGFLVHIKQCHRLKPKAKRRRVWIKFVQYTDASLEMYVVSPEPKEGAIEFIEVRKK